jgi:hypothetical protein
LKSCVSADRGRTRTEKELINHAWIELRHDSKRIDNAHISSATLLLFLLLYAFLLA